MSQPHPVSELGDAAAIFAERTKCALCGSAKSTVHRNFREIPVLRCAECGFLYSGRVMDAEATRAYYQENFGSRRHFEGQQVNARTNATALKRLLDLGKARSWLDVGTGYGFLLEWLQKDPRHCRRRRRTLVTGSAACAWAAGAQNPRLALRGGPSARSFRCRLVL